MHMIGVFVLFALLALAPAACAETWVVEYFPQGSGGLGVFPAAGTYYLVPDQLDRADIGRLYIQTPPSGWVFVGYWPEIRSELPANFPDARLQVGIDIFIYRLEGGVAGLPLGNKLSLHIIPETSECVARGKEFGYRMLRPVDCAELVDLLSDGLARVEPVAPVRNKPR